MRTEECLTPSEHTILEFVKFYSVLQNSVSSTINNKGSQAWQHTSVIPTFRRLRQKMASSRLAWVT
jgi:hypothetical protein